MHYCVLIIFTVATSVIGQTLRPHQQVLIEPEITFEGFGGAPCCGDLGPGPPAPRLPPPLKSGSALGAFSFRLPMQALENNRLALIGRFVYCNSY